MPLQDDSPLCRLSSSSRCVHKSAKFKAFFGHTFSNKWAEQGQEGVERLMGGNAL